MIMETIMSNCDARYHGFDYAQCAHCTYGDYCPQNCEKCLEYIHYPTHALEGAPKRNYDCIHMADFYTCKYSCRYTSELMYAIEMCADLQSLRDIKVLSFGCGPCTDLFGLDVLKEKKALSYENIEYRGVDYSKAVWRLVHGDLNNFKNEACNIKFYYGDMCKLIDTIAAGSWIPNLIVFQYVFSDLQKHSDRSSIDHFINRFSEYWNDKVKPGSYIIFNDVNLGLRYGGGREYFDRTLRKLRDVKCCCGYFRNDNTKNSFYPHGYPYGREYPKNENQFDWSHWSAYAPFNTCASAQMIVKKVMQK